MKRLLFIIASVLFVHHADAQIPAPITGTLSVCQGSVTLLSDATPGGSWSSSAPSIAFVNPATGSVAGIAAGVVNITYTVGTHYATTAFVVRALPVLTPDTILGCVGSTYYINALPNGGGWVSSNPAIASVNFVGAVTGVAPGVATITYTAAGGCVSTASVTINPIPLPITGINYVYSSFTTTLADLTPGGVWSTSNASLATVASTGIVTGVSAGLVLISYTIPGTGCASTYRVDVSPLPGTSNLYAWYPFCGDTTDHSGLGRDLLNYIGTPATLAPDRFGNADNAYHFSGGNCIMEYSTFFPNSGVPPDYTISCWVYPSATPQSSIILFNGNPNTDGYGFAINDGTGFPGGPGTFVSVVFGGIGQFLPVDLNSGGFVLNAWHNLLLVKSGNSYRFYIDDISQGFFISPYNIPSIGSVFALGGNASGLPLPQLGFNGSIDDVAVINRQLSNAERLSMYFFNPDAVHFTLGHDTTICSDNIRLHPNPQTLGGAYTWQTYTTGFGYVTTDTVDTVNIVYPIPGPLGNSYLLKISKPYGCTAADTITVYKNPIPVNLGPDRNFCVGDTITLSSYFPGSSFLWSTGDTTHYLKVTTTGNYYVTIDSVIHLGPGDSAICVGRDTAYLHASTVPVLTAPANVTNCAGNPDTVFTHADPGYTYLWSNGFTGDSAFLNATGTYWVRVNDSGCVRTDTIRGVIIDEAVTLLNVDTAICFGDKVVAHATVNPAVTYQWTPTAGLAVSNLPNVFIVPDTSAEYYLTVTFPGCPNIVDSFHVDVQPRPSVNIGGNRDVCEGDTLHITAKVNPGWYHHFIYSWSPINADLNYTDSDVVVFYAATRHDSEELIVKVYPPVFLSTPADSLCYAKDSAAIFVHPRFNDTIAGRFDFCPGDSLKLIPNLDSLANALGVVVTSAVWSPTNYLDNPNSLNPWIRPITSLGYRMIAYSQYGCADTVYTSIVVHPAALVNLGDSVILYPGESYHIQPQTNCASFLWYPPLGLNNANVSDPVATPMANTTYIVHAATEDGCLVTDSIRLHVDTKTLIAIPNAFTPDGSVNSVFSIIPRGLVGLNYFRIFDRWGNKVFETKNINQGWDGNYNGKPQPFGVYVYDIEAITNTGVVFHREGNVTLIR